MICVKFTAFCDLQVDLRIRLATLRMSARKFWFCKLALTCVDLRVQLARALVTLLQIQCRCIVIEMVDSPVFRGLLV